MATDPAITDLQQRVDNLSDRLATAEAALATAESRIAAAADASYWDPVTVGNASPYANQDQVNTRYSSIAAVLGNIASALRS